MNIEKRLKTIQRACNIIAKNVRKIHHSRNFNKNIDYMRQWEELRDFQASWRSAYWAMVLFDEAYDNRVEELIKDKTDIPFLT